jgi:hypothetical protein
MILTRIIIRDIITIWLTLELIQYRNSTIGAESMKKKCFLTGIPGLALVFVLAFTGCPTDGGDGGGGGGGGDSLVMTWGDDDRYTNLSEVAIFTNSASTSVTAGAGAKIAYYAVNLTGGNDIVSTGTTDKLDISGTQYTVASPTADRFSLTDYIPANNQAAPPVSAQSVTFNRATGTSGTGLQGIWVSDLADTHAQYTIILIGGNNGKKVWSSTSWGVANYVLSTGANGPLIAWNNANPVSYTNTVNASNVSILTITLPGQNQSSTLYPLKTSPTF